MTPLIYIAAQAYWKAYRTLPSENHATEQAREAIGFAGSIQEGLNFNYAYEIPSSLRMLADYLKLPVAKEDDRLDMLKVITILPTKVRHFVNKRGLLNNQFIYYLIK